MNPLEEKESWHAFIEGDIDALSSLFKKYINKLNAYGLEIYPDVAVVKDAIQETFVKLILKRHKLKKYEDFQGLVFKMLRNRIFDEIKSISRNKRIENQSYNTVIPFETDAEYHHIDSEEKVSRNRTLTAALNKLSAHQKEAIFLRFSNGFSYEQISDLMGISIPSVRTLIYRALKELKSIINT